ncbi:hypothetical protein CRM79_05630 [Pantoea agglomerans]|nr:hypothetical protein CRM79_05630 [Pantoea agglomerans]
MWHDLSGGQDCSSRVALSAFPAQKTCTACTGFLLKSLSERLLYRFRTAEKKRRYAPADATILRKQSINTLN